MNKYLKYFWNIPNKLNKINSLFRLIYTSIRYKRWGSYGFSYKVRDYMTNQMCVDASVYEDKIMKEVPNEAELFRKFADYLLSVDVSEMDEYGSGFSDDAWDYFAKLKHNTSDEVNEIARLLLIKFKSYKCNGQLDLYIHTDTDTWEPLTVVSKSLWNEMKELDKDTFNKLPDPLTIYRGTCQAEFDNGNFGQSWSTEILQAKKFAYDLNQEKAQTHTRVVIRTQIPKSYIFAYVSHQEESLCILNTKGLVRGSIEVLESKIIKQYKY